MTVNYHVRLSSVPASWSYETTQGDVPDGSDLVQLGDGWTYSWAWEGGVVPGQLEPATAICRILARDSALLGFVDVGQLVQLEVWLEEVGVGDTYVLDKVLRITAVSVELTPADDDDPAPYPAVAVLELVDLLADLRPTTITKPLGIPAHTYLGTSYPYQSKARDYWRPRLAEGAKRAGHSVGNPDWWDLVEQPPTFTVNGTPSPVAYRGLRLCDPVVGGFDNKSPMQLLTELLNSHQPLPSGTTANILHTVVPYYGNSYPAGYEFVGGLPPGSEYGPGDTVPPDPGGYERFMLVPASRRGPTSQDWHAALTLEAGWCEVPAKARRSREHVVNTARMGGVALIDDPSTPTIAFAMQPAVVDVVDAADVAANGPSSRDVPTQLVLFVDPNPLAGDTYAYPGVAQSGNRFLSVVSARNAGYTYDEFVVDGSLVPEADQLALFPLIPPRAPGEADGDGLVLRHVTIDNLDDAVGFGASSVSGFVKAGTLTIADGALSWTLRLTPGDPT